MAEVTFKGLTEEEAEELSSGIAAKVNKMQRRGSMRMLATPHHKPTFGVMTDSTTSTKTVT